MEIGSGVSLFDAVQEAAHVDSHGEGTVSDGDPFALSKEEFMKGMQEFGQHLQLDEAALTQLWDAISDDKPAIGKDDFKLSDIQEAAHEFTGKKASLMSTFADAMDVLLKEE